MDLYLCLIFNLQSSWLGTHPMDMAGPPTSSWGSPSRSGLQSSQQVAGSLQDLTLHNSIQECCPQRPPAPAWPRKNLAFLSFTYSKAGPREPSLAIYTRKWGQALGLSEPPTSSPIQRAFFLALDK